MTRRPRIRDRICAIAFQQKETEVTKVFLVRTEQNLSFLCHLLFIIKSSPVHRGNRTEGNEDNEGFSSLGRTESLLPSVQNLHRHSGLKSNAASGSCRTPR